MLSEKQLIIEQLRDEFTLEEAVLNWMDVAGDERRCIDKAMHDPFSSDEIITCLGGEEIASRRLEEARFLQDAITAGCTLRLGMMPEEDYVSRAELTTLANKLGERPRFLFPDQAGLGDLSTRSLPEIDDTLPNEVAINLSNLIEVANRYWAGVAENDFHKAAKKEAITQEIMEKTGCSKSVADKIDTFIRPKWAQKTTWTEKPNS